MRFCLRLLLVPLTLAICLSSAARADDEPSGSVSVGVPHLLKTLDPALALYEGERLVVHNLFDQLFEFHHLERPYALRPCLAASMPALSADGRVMTIKLNPAARFEDDACFPGGKGRPVTSSDVVFCLQRLMDATLKSPGAWVLDRRIEGLDAFKLASAKHKPDPRRTQYGTKAGYPRVKGLETPDDHTLRLRLTRPCPELPWLLALSYASIYPPEAIAKYGATFGRNPVSSGPYSVSSFTSEQRITLARSKSFRGATYPTSGESADEERRNLVDAGKPLPRNSLVFIQAFTQPNDEWNALLSGEVDCAEMSRDAATSSLVRSRTRLIEGLRTRGLQMQRHPRMEIFYYVFNMADKVLGHAAGEKGLAIRRAISLANDETWNVNRLYGGLAERVFSPILPEFPEYDRSFSNEWMLQPGEDREAALGLARELLEEVGHPKGKGLPTFRMLITPHASAREQFSRFQAQMADVGLKFEADAVSWPELLKALKEKKFQMAPTSWIADYPDAHNFLELFYGPNAPDPNFGNYSNADYDELFERARKMAPDHDDHESLYHRMRNKVVDDCPWVFRFRRIRYGVVQPWVNGYRFNDLAPKYLQYLWIDKAARKKALAK